MGLKMVGFVVVFVDVFVVFVLLLLLLLFSFLLSQFIMQFPLRNSVVSLEQLSISLLLPLTDIGRVD